MDELLQNDLESHNTWVTIKCSVLLIFWVVNLAATLAGLVFSLFLSVTYQDLDVGKIEPMELSESINQVRETNLFCCSISFVQFLPYDVLCSGIFTLISILSGQTLIGLLAIPLFAYNLNQYYLRKDKVHFVTLRDFLPMKYLIRRQLYAKTAYYVVIFMAAVVMFIISVVRLIHIIL